MQQSTPLRFHPTTGRPFVGQNPLAAEFRSTTFSGFWVYDPWTGHKRDPRDIEMDHHGKMIIPAGEAVYATGSLLPRTDFKAPNLPEVTKPEDLVAGRWYILIHKERKCWSWLMCINRGTQSNHALAFDDHGHLLWCTPENNPVMHRYHVYGHTCSPHQLVGKIYIQQ